MRTPPIRLLLLMQLQMLLHFRFLQACSLCSIFEEIEEASGHWAAQLPFEIYAAGSLTGSSPFASGNGQK